MPPLIAIIDDDRPSTEFIAALLQDAGYRTITSTTHDTILDLVRDHRPDLFIVDLMRRGAYVGAVTLSLLRDHPATAAVPVILCSANAKFLHAQRAALWQRKCLTLTKPFLHHELLDVAEEPHAES